MYKLLLNFSNIKISLEFQKESLVRPFKNTIIEQINSNYEAFIVKNTNEINYKIIFQDSGEIKQIKFKGKNFYSEFYIKASKKTYKTYYHISPIQFQLLLHLILHDFAKKNALLILHSSANLINGKSALFIGKPGNGKTTIMTMLSDIYAPLADDSFIVDINKDKYISYQTPFVEKIKFISRKPNSIPLGRIFLLKKSTRYRIHQITDKNLILKSLLKNCLVDSKEDIQTYLQKAHNLANKFSNFYYIEFGLDKNKLHTLFKNNYLDSS